MDQALTTGTSTESSQNAPTLPRASARSSRISYVASSLCTRNGQCVAAVRCVCTRDEERRVAAVRDVCRRDGERCVAAVRDVCTRDGERCVAAVRDMCTRDEERCVGVMGRGV